LQQVLDRETQLVPPRQLAVPHRCRRQKVSQPAPKRPRAPFQLPPVQEVQPQARLQSPPMRVQSPPVRVQSPPVRVQPPPQAQAQSLQARVPQRRAPVQQQALQEQRAPSPRALP